MKKNNEEIIVLPVDGITTASTAEKVEQALLKLPGVSSARADSGHQQIELLYDPAQSDLLDFQDTIRSMGCDLPVEQTNLDVRGMSCMSCVAHVEGALTDLPGVLTASVQLSTASAQVTSVAGLLSIAQMEQSIQDAGYHASAAGSQAAEAGAVAGEAGRNYDASRIGRLKRLFQRN